ncbi:MAG: XTP/dITP diphosphatase [Candidatus Thorarchaeota archaeon]|nr:MAG: XTP/dITP diphosphatase [Candidatus Thorarchaeota archaeon]
MSRDRLVLVTQNKHKLDEITPLFREANIEFESSALEKLEIRSDSVNVVAEEASRDAFEKLQKPVIVDDTGLYIDALNGFPRAYPAFILETIGLEGVLKLLEGAEDRGARFVTAVAFCDGSVSKTFTGEMKGTIAKTIVGAGGFGYDPIFVPEGHSRTYAQLSTEQKVSISHRSRAFRSFIEWFKESSDNA